MLSMTSSPDSLLSCQPRWTTPRTDRLTYGARVARIADELGTPLMPWQRHVVDVALEIDPDTGRLVYREVVLTVPRQSGKTTLLLGVMVQRALGFRTRQNIVYTAQNGNAARKKWRNEHVPILEASSFAKMMHVRQSSGDESIQWRNGSRHSVMASTLKSGHGETIDLALIDEAFAQEDARLEQAFKPAMITRPEPQLWVVSTAGTHAATYLWAKIENGRERAALGLTDSTCYFEWSAEDGADPASVDTWRACMPALGHTITLEAVAADYASMELPEFERAYLNRWNTRRSVRVIDAVDWERSTDDTSTVLDPVTFAIDISPDRAHASIAVAGVRADTRVHMEIVENRQGVAWVVDRVAQLVRNWHCTPVVIGASSPAASLLSDLAAAGVDVKLASNTEHAQACGAFYDGVLNSRYLHRRHPALDVALDGAERRYTGDAWLWSRKSSAVDISPLVAITLAAWGHSLDLLDGPDIADNVW